MYHYLSVTPCVSHTRASSSFRCLLLLLSCRLSLRGVEIMRVSVLAAGKMTNYSYYNSEFFRCLKLADMCGKTATNERTNVDEDKGYIRSTHLNDFVNTPKTIFWFRSLKCHLAAAAVDTTTTIAASDRLLSQCAHLNIAKLNFHRFFLFCFPPIHFFSSFLYFSWAARVRKKRTKASVNTMPC